MMAQTGGLYMALCHSLAVSVALVTLLSKLTLGETYQYHEIVFKSSGKLSIT